MISNHGWTRGHIILKKYVFLDRDGVINRDSPHYIKNCKEFEFLPGSIEAIRRLHLAARPVIVITNQSAINRELTSQKEVKHIHAMMQETIRKRGGQILDIFFCPHHPEEACACRKPKPGLIHFAREKYQIALADAVMIGDSAKDVECARNAGCGRSILVRTGNGVQAESVLAEKGIFPDKVAGNLLDAVNWLLSE